jgi:DNA-binding NarL/FixJ family response regulator
MAAPVRVFLVDDHPVVLAGLVAVLSRHEGIDVAGTATSGEQALEILADLEVDLVLLDHRLGAGIDGVELCRRLSAEPYSLRCLALSAGADATTLRTFLGAGSRGLLLKQADPEHIVDAIHSVMEGDMFVDPRMTTLLMEEVAGTATGLASLNARERAVLRLIAAGFSNPEMARQLCVSHSSIKAYVSSILHKLHVNYRAEAVAIAAREGLLDGAGVTGAAE